MGIAQKQFAGISTNIPGVYTDQQFPPSLGAVTPATNVVAILGEAQGGVPYNVSGKTDAEKINVISSVGEAVNTLIGGNGFYMTEFYLSPTRERELNTPATAWFIRVNPATAATATLQDGSSNDIIDLTTKVYGAVANQVARKIEAGTNKGHKVTIKYRGETVVTQDDVHYDYFDIQYTGGGSAATMTIDGTQLTTTVTGPKPQ